MNDPIVTPRGAHDAAHPTPQQGNAAETGRELAAQRYPLPSSYPTYELDRSRQRPSVGRIYALLDSTFAGIGLLLVFWYVLILGLSGLELSWRSIVLFLGFWLVLTYLALPRLHQMFTTLYIPDYFMARTKTGDGILGDPVNLAVIGSEEDIHAAMQRAGWVKADPITLRSSLGIVKSSITRSSYPEAPVSDLFLFNQKHDFAYQQEVDGNAAQRHHIRFWRVPEGWQLPGGRKVEWLAAGTYDKSVGLSTLTLQITHKIDANTDAERDYVIDTVRYADPECSVDVIPDFSTAYHDRNGGGDAVRTDGSMPILTVSGAAARAEEAGAIVGKTGSHSAESMVHLPNDRLDKKLDRVIPPTQLNFVGVAVVGRFLVYAFALLTVVIVGDEEMLALLGAAVTAVIGSGAQVVLFVLTVKRKRWARLLLLIGTSLGAVYEMWQLTMAEHPSLVRYSGVGLSVLVVLALSAPAVRAWVFALRSRAGVATNSGGPAAA